jgi:hypothetical protein
LVRFSRPKDSPANIIKFESSEGSKLTFDIEVDIHNNVKCNMSFFKHDKIADISELNLNEILYFLQKYKDFIINFNTKLDPIKKLKSDLQVVRRFIKEKRFSALSIGLPVGKALFGFKRLYSIDTSNGNCFAVTDFKKSRLENIISPKVSNQPLLAQLHMLNVRYINNIYDKEISRFSEIIKRLTIYIGILFSVVYLPLDLYIFHGKILQDPFGIDAIYFYFSLLVVPLFWLLVPTLFNYFLNRFISKYIIDYEVLLKIRDSLHEISAKMVLH